jgi:DNA-binding NarL/FixJ family response regulator
MHEDAIFARRALQAGAMGFVTKSSAPAELVEAVLKIADGGKFVSPTVAQNLVWHETATNSRAVDGLTEREFEVLQAIARGQSIKAIARAMGLTPKTVSNHQSSIKQKLQVESTYQLLKVAEQLGLSR